MKVLIVEDSPTMRRIVQNTLRRLGYSDIIEAEDGVDALAKLGEENVDFIVTDWNMPEMNGLEFVQRVKASKKYADIPILMVTTRSVEKDVVQALEAGASSYIIKPFTPQVMRDKINEIFS